MNKNIKWYGLENKYNFPDDDENIKKFQNLLKMYIKQYDISNEEIKYRELKSFIANISEEIIEKNKDIYLLPGLYKSEDFLDTDKLNDFSYSYFIKVIIILIVIEIGNNFFRWINKFYAGTHYQPKK